LAWTDAPEPAPAGYADVAVEGRRTTALWSAGIFAACLLLSYPVANIAQGDDASYVKSALEFARTGHLVYNGWGAPILGWLALWGAAFIRIFGFSFTVLQFSMMLLGTLTIYLFHRILEGFGFSAKEALAGALTLGLTPLYFSLSSMFMTDIPGLLAILVCVWMCMRASDGTADANLTAGWLCAAAVTNLILGSVRQTSWLGALVIVPSTGWMLRKRRGVAPLTCLLWVMSLGIVLSSVAWYNRQPYALVESTHIQMNAQGWKRMLTATVRFALCTVMLMLPLLTAWLPPLKRLSHTGRIVAVAGFAIAGLAVALLMHAGTLGFWLAPWLLPGLAGSLPGFLPYVVSAVVVLVGILFFASLVSQRENAEPWDWQQRRIAWILGPYALVYLGLMMPRASTAFVQDRYLLGLLPVLIVVVLRLYAGRTTRSGVPAVSVVFLVAAALMAVLWNHDSFSRARARKATLDALEREGIQAASVQSGLGHDLWTQMEMQGHINQAKLKNPAATPAELHPEWELPEECGYWVSDYTPVIRPRFYVESEARPCPGAAVREGAAYTAWLPPFHRSMVIQTLPLREHAEAP